jgi:hypothetical protein
MAYKNNIDLGNAPLLWSRMREAFDGINENFTVIAATVGRKAARGIETITLGNPIVITTVDDHTLTSGDRVTVFQTEISQLDGNTYFIKTTRLDTIELYTDEALTTPVDGSAYDAWASPNAGKIQALNEFSDIDFEKMTSNVSPARTDEFNLGSASTAWQRLYLSEYSTTPGMELNGVWLGTAQIKGSDGVIDLPLNSTVNGNLIINPDNTFFKSVQIDNSERIIADNFVDTLNLLSGNGFSMSADSGAESITFTNTGVLSNIAGSGISVSSATGNVTVTNTGVRSLQNVTALPSGRTEGAGVNVNATTGDNVKITNTGVLAVEAGSAALTVFTDDATGIVTITNAAAAGNAYRNVDIDGTILSAPSVAGTLTVDAGYATTITGDAGTQTMTIGFSGVADITGSVFSDDSTKMVDAVENEIYASGGFFGTLTGDVTGNVTGNVTGDLTGNSTGYHTGDVKGSVFGDDSTKIVDAVENKVYADELWGTLRGQTWMAAYDSYLTITNGGSTGPGPIQIVASANLDLTAGAGYTINANRNIVASGGVTGNLTGYHTGDMTGSVFADDSTQLVDAVDGVLRGTHIGDVIGSVFADNSTLLVNGVDGTLAYDATTPGDWDGDAPTTVGAAIDRLATLVKTLNGGTGA